MSNMKKCRYGLITAVVMAAAILITISADSTFALSGPVKNDKGITTWDCVYFGHYPQSSDGNGGFIDEPIKWRVLKVDGEDAYLLSDRNIDAMPYCAADDNPKYDCFWHEATLRSWLNGFDASTNKKGIDYSASNFIDRAFSAEEQEAIKTTEVHTVRESDWGYHHYEKTTYEKIYLLDFNEMQDPAYGFVANEEETITRVALNTAYTAAGGSSGDMYRSPENGRDSWLLRTNGEYSMYADFLTENGEYDDMAVDGNNIQSVHGIRPVLHLDMSKTAVWSEAGKHIARLEQSVKVSGNYVKKYGDKPFDLGADCTGDSVLEYKSDNEAVASVDNNGTVTINGVGNAVITVTAPMTDSYEGAEKTTSITVDKGTATIIPGKKSLVVLASRVKKKAQTVKFISKSSSKGKITYSGKAADKKSRKALKFKNGKITVKKGTKKGTYKMTVTVKAAATDDYKAASKKVTVSVKVK